jgi:flavin reductase (DIM6/NTAB) family NADH-FMN oxidoreductase RutF/rubredoxin
MDTTALRSLTYGMCVIGTKDGDRLTGCTVNTVIQVSSDPLWIAVCVHRDNFTNSCIKASGGFSVSILSEEATGETIGAFGFRSGKEVNKFDGIDYQLTADNFPVLTSGVCGWLSCKVVKSVELETHTMFFGILTDAQQIGGNPMTYSYYHTVVKGKAPKNAPTFVKETPKNDAWKCSVCGYEYDDSLGPFAELYEAWLCPICGAGKELFEKV